MDGQGGESKASEGNPIDVTVLLAGGHRGELRLPTGDPLLAALVAAVDAKSGQERPHRSFNLRVEGGRRSLIFSSRDVVGLLTEPPLALEPPAPVPFLLAEDFLPAEAHRALVDFAVASEARFSGSTVSTSDDEYRRSRVLFDFAPWSDLFRERMRGLAPQLMQRLGVAPFRVGDVEAQLTASNDGNYYRVHNDSGSADTRSRTLTFVYYFFREPRGFEGGALRMYESRVENGFWVCGEKSVDIAPKNNSVLFFPSFRHHEVLKVSCPSRQFAGSRFTVNGWIRAAA